MRSCRSLLTAAGLLGVLAGCQERLVAEVGGPVVLPAGTGPLAVVPPPTALAQVDLLRLPALVGRVTLESAILERATLRALSPADGGLAFVGPGVQVVFRSGEREVVLGVGSPERGAPVMTLAGNGVELAAAGRVAPFSVRLVTPAGQQPAEETRLELTARFSVLAD